MQTTKTLFVTGCFSFIGWEFVKQALKKGYFVYGLDKRLYPSKYTYRNYIETHDQQYMKNFILQDETDIVNVKTIPSCDFIVNFAAESHVTNSIMDCSQFIKTNIDGVRNLLDVVKNRESRPRFIQISTDEVYGDIVSGFYTEGDMLNPSNPYAASKASADLLVMSYGRTHNIKYNIFRPTNNFGNFQYHEKLIPLAVQHLIDDTPIPLHDKGTPIRTWMHVSDTARAILSVIETGVENEIYNCTSYYELQNKEVCDKIIKIYNNITNSSYSEFYDYNCFRPGQDVRYAIDCDKLTDETGWLPETKEKFDEFLEEAVKSAYKDLV